MRKLAKYIFVFLFIMIVVMGKDVYAEEPYYTNSKGVSFTKEQYDFYTYLTHEGFQENVTQDMLNEIAGQDLNSLDVKVIKLCPTKRNSGKENQLRDDNTYFATQYKSIAMGKYCSNTGCRVIAEAEWFDVPNIKSYDVMGAYLDGPTRLNTPTTFITTSEDATEEETIVYDTDGFGAVFVIPDGDDIFIAQTFNYSGTGTIYFSYQHAMSYTTLNTAQLFNIGLIGYGNVFEFYGAATGVYDQMPGVHMDV